MVDERQTGCPPSIGLEVDRPKLADACRRIVRCMTNLLEGRRA